MNEPIHYTYRFEFDDRTPKTFQISLNPITLEFLPATAPSKPDCSKLQFYQCERSLGTEVEYCPVAVNLQHIVEGFKGRDCTEKVNVMVEINERKYQNREVIDNSLEELRFLILH